MKQTTSLETSKLRDTIPTSAGIEIIKQIHNSAITVIPFLGFMGALYLFFRGNGPQSIDVAVLLIMWLVSGFGITVGFHRLLTHHSFKPVRPVKIVLAIMGCMAVQGPPISWVSIHRKHHDHSDQWGDPHSPWLAEGRLKSWWGLWHAHVGWMFQYDLPNPIRYAPDLVRDKTIVWVNRTYLLWVVLGLTIPSVIELLFTHSWGGVARGVLWGGLVRLFLVQHIIWSINSICHCFGAHGLRTRDQSRNNLWLAIPSLGESWHNNHHAFPNSSRLGLMWWQIDIGYWLISLLDRVELVHQVKTPSLGSIEAKEIR